MFELLNAQSHRSHFLKNLTPSFLPFARLSSLWTLFWESSIFHNFVKYQNSCKRNLVKIGCHSRRAINGQWQHGCIVAIRLYSGPLPPPSRSKGHSCGCPMTDPGSCPMGQSPVSEVETTWERDKEKAFDRWDFKAFANHLLYHFAPPLKMSIHFIWSKSSTASSIFRSNSWRPQHWQL